MSAKPQPALESIEKLARPGRSSGTGPNTANKLAKLVENNPIDANNLEAFKKSRRQSMGHRNGAEMLESFLHGR
jgi:hypothetical protein